MLAEFNPDFKYELREIYKVADELLAIMVASIKTANNNRIQTSETQTQKSKI